MLYICQACSLPKIACQEFKAFKRNVLGCHKPDADRAGNLNCGSPATTVTSPAIYRHIGGKQNELARRIRTALVQESSKRGRFFVAMHRMRKWEAHQARIKQGRTMTRVVNVHNLLAALARSANQKADDLADALAVKAAADRAYASATRNKSAQFELNYLAQRVADAARWVRAAQKADAAARKALDRHSKTMAPLQSVLDRTSETLAVDDQYDLTAHHYRMMADEDIHQRSSLSYEKLMRRRYGMHVYGMIGNARKVRCHLCRSKSDVQKKANRAMNQALGQVGSSIKSLTRKINQHQRSYNHHARDLARHRTHYRNRLASFQRDLDRDVRIRQDRFMYPHDARKYDNKIRHHKTLIKRESAKATTKTKQLQGLVSKHEQILRRLRYLLALARRNSKKIKAFKKVYGPMNKLYSLTGRDGVRMTRHWRSRFEVARNQYRTAANRLRNELNRRDFGRRSGRVAALYARKVMYAERRMRTTAERDPLVQSNLRAIDAGKAAVDDVLSGGGANANILKAAIRAEDRTMVYEGRLRAKARTYGDVLRTPLFRGGRRGYYRFLRIRNRYQYARSTLLKALRDRTTKPHQKEALARRVMRLRMHLRAFVERDPLAKRWRAKYEAVSAGVRTRLTPVKQRYVDHFERAMYATIRSVSIAVTAADDSLTSAARIAKNNIKKSNPFYTINRNGALVLKNWSVLPTAKLGKGFRPLMNKRTPTKTGILATGKLVGPSFVAKKDTIAFTVGGGDRKTSVVLLKDDSMQVLRKFVATGGKEREVFWDISEFSQEMLRVVVRDESKSAGIFFSNLRVFDEPDKRAGCLPDCLPIAPTGYRTFRTRYRAALKILGDTYAAESPKSKITVGKRLQLCRTGPQAFGANHGAKLYGRKAFKFPLQPQIRKGVSLPACIFVEKSMQPRGYVITLGEDPTAQYLFSSKHTDKDAAKGNPNLQCIYPTKRPRCAEYRGLVRRRYSFKLNCVSKETHADCFEAIYSQQCGKTARCGEEKGHRQMLHCCDVQNGNLQHNCHGSHSRRRRLGASMAFREYALAGPAVKRCADECMRQKSCVAWNLSPQGRCALTEKCVLKPAEDGTTDFLDWMVLPGLNKADLFGENAKLTADGRVAIQTLKWQSV